MGRARIRIEITDASILVREKKTPRTRSPPSIANECFPSKQRGEGRVPARSPILCHESRKTTSGQKRGNSRANERSTQRTQTRRHEAPSNASEIKKIAAPTRRKEHDGDGPKAVRSPGRYNARRPKTSLSEENYLEVGRTGVSKRGGASSRSHSPPN